MNAVECLFIYSQGFSLDFPCSLAGKESACNAGDLGSIPELGRIPWRRERLPTPVFWPGEFHGHSRWGRKESDMTERLSLSRILLMSLAILSYNSRLSANEVRPTHLIFS